VKHPAVDDALAICKKSAIGTSPGRPLKPGPVGNSGKPSFGPALGDRRPTAIQGPAVTTANPERCLRYLHPTEEIFLFWKESLNAR
jgi:hypothetical protein